jgi:hypothetical protein
LRYTFISGGGYHPPLQHGEDVTADRMDAGWAESARRVVRKIND